MIQIYKKQFFEHLLFFVLGFLAVLLFKERLYADSAYYIFRVVDHESFWIEHSRFVLFFSQVLPLFLVKLGFGLKSILIAYSVGHIVFYYVIFLVCRYGLKNEHAGITILLLQTLGTLQGFFTPMFELYYACTLLVLFYSLLNSKYDSLFLLFIILILAFIILTSHPMTIIPYLLIICLYISDQGFSNNKIHLISLISVIAVVVLFKKFTVSEYESNHFSFFGTNLKTKSYDIKYFIGLGNYMFTYYWELLCVFLLSVIGLIKEKKWVHLFFVTGSFFVSLAIFNIAYYGFKPSRYHEQVYYSLVFIVSLSLVVFLQHNSLKKYNAVFISIALLLVGIRVYRIYEQSIGFSDRIAEMELLIDNAQQQKHSKFIVEEKSMKHGPNWSYPMETMLLSSIKENNKTITICTDTDYNFNSNNTIINPEDYLFRKWEIYPVSSLNNAYFHLDKMAYVSLF